MMQRPWDCAQPDEWLPRNLRLCWGSSDGGDSTGASTGGGDWGSSGSFDASGFNADAYGGDPTAGWAIDAANGFGQFGTGPGEWYDAGPYNAAGLNSPGFQPTEAGYAALESGGAYNPGAGLPGVTTGGGDWGSAGAFSAAGTGGGPGGAMFGAGVGTGAGLYGGGGGGGSGGGLLGDYGGGGGYTGGGGGGGGRGGGGAFGSFGTLGASNTGRGSEAPSAVGFADTAGGGRSAGPASVARSEAPTRGEAEVSSVSQADQDAPAPDAGPEAAPEAEPLGAPQASEPPSAEPPSSPSEAAPSKSEAAPSREEAAPDYQGSPYADMGPSSFGPQSLDRGTPDYQGSPYGDMGPPSQAQPDWGSVFEAPSQAPQDVGQWGDLSGIYSTGISNLLSQVPGWFSQAQENPAAQNYIDARPLSDVSTWLSPQNQQTFNEITSLPGAFYNALNPSVPTMLQAPSTMDLQARGEQGRAGQLFSTPGIDPATAQYATAPDPATQLGIENLAAPDPTDWGSVFEGAAPTAEPNWGEVFEAPAQDPNYGEVFEGADPFVGIEPGAEQTWAPTDTQTIPVEVVPSTELPTNTPNPLANQSQPEAPQEAQPQPQETAPEAQPAPPTYDTTMESGPPGALPSTDDTSTPGGDPALSGYPSTVPITLEAIANAVRGAEPDLPGAPEGPQTAPSGITSSIPGGRTTDFNYGPPQGQPGLADMRGQPGMPMPQARPAEAPQPGQPGGIGSDYVAGDAADLVEHNTPEPADNHNPPGDPNAPRPPGNIPGRLIGEGGQYDNAHADTPQTSRTYRNSGRTDYPQGRPGIDFRTARQAGIVPLFRTDGINTHDNDARLVENINRALRAMEQRTGIPASSLVATSGWRGAYRTNALEHGMVEETGQESVYSRSNPVHGHHFPAAQPGNSNHGPGRAIDFARSRALTWLREHAREFDLETIPGDYPHIQLRGARGVANVRPSEQEQAGQRAIDTQNRQAAIDRGLIGGGRGQAPVQQARPAAPPGGWRGIGGDIGREARMAPLGAPPAAAVPPADIPPPAALPPRDEPPAPRPPADIPIEIPAQAPAPFLAPPRAGRVDPMLQTRFANDLLKDATKNLNKQSGEADFAAASVQGAKALAAAGIPLAMARSLMTQGAYQGAVRNGYDINSFPMGGVYKSKIDAGIDAALQGYSPAKPGEAQGPYGFQPDAPRALAKGGHADEDEPVVVGEEGPEVFVPDRPGTVLPHMPRPGGPGNVDRWPKVPAVGYPGQYGGVEREIRRQTRSAQDVVPGLMDMIDSGRLRLNAANWQRMISDPSLIALGRSRIEDRRPGY